MPKAHRTGMGFVLNFFDGTERILIEAHDGLSAKLVNDSGFDGIWASSFSISTSLGVRDCNEASWSQVNERVRSMRNVTEHPIFVDADSGYGDANLIRHVVSQYEFLESGGICIEDRVFPKRNSFNQSGSGLVTAEEHSARIHACREGRSKKSIAIVARTEALVAGETVEQALIRADAYKVAGADAILVQSVGPSPEELFAFSRLWDNQLPLIVVPTAFRKMSFNDFFNNGYKVVICANQMILGALKGMLEVSQQILDSKNLDLDIPSMQEVFKMYEYDKILN